MSAVSAWTRRLQSQLRLDAAVVWRARSPHVVVGMAALFGLIIRFAIPAEVDVEPTVYVADARSSAHAPAAIDGAQVLDSAEAVRAAVAADARSAGFLFEDGGATALLPGGTTDASAAIAATVAARALHPDAAPTWTMTTLRPPSAPPPFNRALLPLLFVMDVAALGFLFGGVMVLQEKTDQTIRFYRATPGGAGPYLVSKAAVLLGLVLLNLAVLLGCAWPAALANFRAIAVVATGALALSLLGLGLSVFFRTLTSFFYPLVAVALVINLPTVLYAAPSLDLPAARLIPTWTVLFGARELLFPTGRAGVFLDAMGSLLPALALCAAFAWWATDRRLLREV